MHTGITGTTHTFVGDYTRYIHQNKSIHSQHLHNIKNNTNKKNTPKHITNCFNKRTTNKTNRSINSATQKIQGYIITLTTTHVQEAIKQGKNNLKHIGPLGFAFLTSMLKTALNNNIIPHIWKLANIVTIQKSNKDIDNLIQAHIPPLINC